MAQRKWWLALRTRTTTPQSLARERPARFSEGPISNCPEDTSSECRSPAGIPGRETVSKARASSRISLPKTLQIRLGLGLSSPSDHCNFLAYVFLFQGL